MTKIHVLSAGFTSPNGSAFLMPLIKFQQDLKNLNIDITIFYAEKPNLTDCDYLLIDSKVFKPLWSQNFEGAIEKLASLCAKTKVIWCDQGDSTGTFLGQVVPHVHRYLKAQLLKDRSEYMREHYASRIFTEYYHKKYGVSDSQPYITQPVQNHDDLKKLDVSWNSAFMHYGVLGTYLLRLRGAIPCNAPLFFAQKIRDANTPRNIDISCRMGISYPRESVCFQRKKMRELLSAHLPTDKLSRPAYFKEMSNSKICISPFGLGEITLKDFECFLTGTLLLKPNMNHMDTWPNLFENNQTCVFHSWDLDDVEEKIEWLLSHDKERIEIAQNGQNRYLEHTIGKNAAHIFAEHFSKIVL